MQQIWALEGRTPAAGHAALKNLPCVADASFVDLSPAPLSPADAWAVAMAASSGDVLVCRAYRLA